MKNSDNFLVAYGYQFRKEKAQTTEQDKDSEFIQHINNTARSFFKVSWVAGGINTHSNNGKMEFPFLYVLLAPQERAMATTLITICDNPKLTKKDKIQQITEEMLYYALHWEESKMVQHTWTLYHNIMPILRSYYDERMYDEKNDLIKAIAIKNGSARCTQIISIIDSPTVTSSRRTSLK